MNKKSLNLFECLTTLAMLCIGIFVIIHANSLPLFGPRSLSPGLFPLISGVAICICAAALLAVQLKTFLRSKKIHLPKRLPDDRGIVFPIVLIFLYVFALPKLHFIPTTIAFLIILMSLFRKKLTLSTTVISVATVFVIYLVFSKLLMIRLP